MLTPPLACASQNTGASSSPYCRQRPVVRRAIPGSTPRAPAADGRIYYSTKHEIWSVSTAGGDERPLKEIPRRSAEFNDSWGLTAEGVYFINPDPPRPGIDFVEFGGARIVRVVDLPGRPFPWGGALALSPDGGRLVYSQLDGIDSDIMLVNNFR